jgi:hypothetical protein
MKKYQIHFGIGARLDDGMPTYEYFDSQAERDAALEQRYADARKLTDGRVRLYQCVLSLGDSHLALELPAAQPVSYLAVVITVPEPKYPIMWRMKGAVELFSGEVEVFPEDAREKDALQLLLSAKGPDVPWQDFCVNQSGGGHHDGRQRCIYERISLALNRTGLRLNNLTDLRTRLLRAKAFDQRWTEKRQIPLGTSEREAIEKLPVSKLVPAFA